MANSEFIPRKATKSRVKLKMAIQGPSGSGKTEGALALAKHLVPDGKVLLIDTENESASLYANRYDFDTIPLAPPYGSDRYKAAMQVAVEHKYDVLIVDSITHQWDGVGGILRRKEELDRQPGSNSYTNWSRFTPEHTAFIEFIKQIPVHTIVTMRSKQDYVLEANDKGKQTPKKVGMAPIQRDGTEYEYTLVFDVDMAHKAIASKNRTTLFQNFEVVDLADPRIAISIREWLDDGEDPQPTPATTTNGNGAHAQRGAFKYDNPNLICQPIDVRKQKANKRDAEYIAVKLNGECEGTRVAYCWHTSLFEALLASQGVQLQVEVEKKDDFVNIVDVIAVAGRSYRDGKPYDKEDLGITDEDIPF